MKIIVTIGTTPFDELVRRVDKDIARSHVVRFQIGTGRYTPQNGFYTDFFTEIQQEVDLAEMVICHAGAGTVYPLLEQGKRFIVVPNLFRRDKHQRELAAFVERNNFGEVVWDLDLIADAVNRAENCTYREYNKYSFFLAEELSAMITNSISDTSQLHPVTDNDQ